MGPAARCRGRRTPRRKVAAVLQASARSHTPQSAPCTPPPFKRTSGLATASPRGRSLGIATVVHGQVSGAPLPGTRTLGWGACVGLGPLGPPGGTSTAEIEADSQPPQGGWGPACPPAGVHVASLRRLLPHEACARRDFSSSSGLAVPSPMCGFSVFREESSFGLPLRLGCP